VLIHGWPLSGEAWSDQVGPLSAAGYRVVSYDRRGFGRSDKPSSSFDYDTFAKDLDKLLTELELTDVTLVGFSMGGGEVARYIAKRGEDRLRSVVLAAAVPPYKVSEAQRQQAIALCHQSDQKAALASMEAFGTTDFRDDLTKVTVPTLVLHGAGDATVLRWLRSTDARRDRAQRAGRRPRCAARAERQPHGRVQRRAARLPREVEPARRMRSSPESALLSADSGRSGTVAP